MILKTIALSSAALLIAGASHVAFFDKTTFSNAYNKSETAHHHDHHAGYVKPGAAVEMTHDYDGQTAPGEYETVTLTLTHMYEDGYLDVDILPTADLQVFSNIPPKQTQLHYGSSFSLPIQFSGTVIGTYSIAVEAIYNSPDGQQSRRVLSLPITIGAKPAGKTQPAAPKTSKSTGTGFIALPAVEVIR